MDSNEPQQLLGLAQASIAGSFTTTQTVISLLYDSMTVAWNNGGAEPERMPSTSFTIVASPAARGRPIQLVLNGFSQPGGAGSVQLQIGRAQFTAQAGEETYSTTVNATLSADADTTRVVVTLDLPKPTDDSAAMLALDTIDLSLVDCQSAD